MLSAAQPVEARAGYGPYGMKLFGSLLAGAVMAVGLSACGSGPRVQASTPVVSAETVPVKLSANQLLVVEASVKTMIANPESARFSRATGLSFAGKPGVHVCGHVTYKAEDGAPGTAQPYYLELHDKAGTSVAERGQVGSNPSALSKVNFLCRRHYPG